LGQDRSRGRVQELFDARPNIALSIFAQLQLSLPAIVQPLAWQLWVLPLQPVVAYGELLGPVEHAKSYLIHSY
jgi:hypothetical protein